jgi:hypothetical protein
MKAIIEFDLNNQNERDIHKECIQRNSWKEVVLQMHKALNTFKNGKDCYSDEEMNLVIELEGLLCWYLECERLDID